MRHVYFSNRMHGAMVNETPILFMEIPYNESYLFLVSECLADLLDKNP